MVLNTNELTTFGNIPTKALKQSCKSCYDAFQKLFNDTLRHGNFQYNAKFADV